MLRLGHRLVALVILVVLPSAGLSAHAFDISEQDVEEARLEREEAARLRAAALTDVEAAIASYEALNAELQDLTFKVGRLRSRLDTYEARNRELRLLIRDRAVESYMSGPERDEIARVFSPEEAQQSILASEVLALAVDTDRAALDDLMAATAEMERLQEELAADTERVSLLRVESEAVVERMNQLFAEAAATYQEADTTYQEASAALAEKRRREEEERRRREAEEKRRQEVRAALGAPAEGVPLYVTPGFICPIAAPTWFTDTWGAPRAGGRRHSGTDMFAAFRAPLVAVADGTVKLSFSALGGNTLWLYADHGVEYFYAHLDGYADGLTNGQRVTRGTLIGYNGDTGNAAPGAYHVHFGIRPGGIMMVNPYPTVRAVCP